MTIIQLLTWPTGRQVVALGTGGNDRQWGRISQSQPWTPVDPEGYIKTIRDAVVNQILV